jgi:hypothetical protein
MNAFEPLFWMGAVYLLVRIINGGSPTLWLWFGVLIGIGIENKHSTVFFRRHFVGLLLTPERHHFARNGSARGARICHCVAVLWQARHHWPVRVAEQYRSQQQNVALSPARS